MYFVLYKSKDNKFYFVIKANNGEVVATSETYYTKYSAQSTIDSIKRNINASTSVIDMTV